jgi:hypothetical protein
VHEQPQQPAGEPPDANRAFLREAKDFEIEAMMPRSR